MTTLHNFNEAQGSYPSFISQRTNGVFYGTTSTGGSDGADGTIYGLSIGLAPFTKLLPASGSTGSVVEFLGQGFTGASGVSFNGASATTFKILSDTYMNAVVPSGATTGPVTVTTPDGTLTSNVSFVVQ